MVSKVCALLRTVVSLILPPERIPKEELTAMNEFPSRLGRSWTGRFSTPYPGKWGPTIVL